MRLAGLLLLVPALAAAEPVQVSTVDPRPFGHTIGDTLERVVVLNAESPWVLDPESLPAAGRASLWFELRKPRLSARRAGLTLRYEIRLAYQAVNSPEQVSTVALPEFALRFTGGAESQSVTVPEQPVTLGPLTPASVLARAGLDEMRPDLPAPPVPTAAIRQRLALYAALGAALLLYAAHLRWGLGTLFGRRGPFARAVADLSRLPTGPGAQVQALRRLHRAFDESAGRTVFAEQLGEFLAAHPRFAPEAAAIERFYALSRQVFFGGGAPGAEGADWVEALARRCRDLERRAP